MQEVDRLDFATFFSLWLCREKYKAGLISKAEYNEMLNLGVDSVSLIRDQIREQEVMK